MFINRYAHGSDLCHDLELRHAMANCFEALMGALFLDGDISVAGIVSNKIIHFYIITYSILFLQLNYRQGIFQYVIYE